MSSEPQRTILIATRNPGKQREMVAVLCEDSADSPLSRVNWPGVDEVAAHLPDPPENEPTFAANAVFKARYWSRATGLWTLADDSGLEVDALGGAPGVRSARFSLPDGAPSPDRPPDRLEIDAANNRKLIAALAGVPEDRRTARFRCALALVAGDRVLATAEGTIEGRIIDLPRGSGGFGYDPHFLVPELNRTTAELALSEKNRISHRGRALRLMRRRLIELLRASPASSDAR